MTTTRDTVVIGPAYGVDYKSGEEARAAFWANTDFELLSVHKGIIGKYLSRNNITKWMPEIEFVEIRYSQKKLYHVVEL